MHTCNLDNRSDPVDFAGQDSVGVQDFHLHPYGDVVPLGTQWSLQSERPDISLQISVICTFTIFQEFQELWVILSKTQSLLC